MLCICGVGSSLLTNLVKTKGFLRIRTTVSILMKLSSWVCWRRRLEKEYWHLYSSLIPNQYVLDLGFIIQYLYNVVEPIIHLVNLLRLLTKKKKKKKKKKITASKIFIKLNIYIYMHMHVHKWVVLNLVSFFSIQ